MRTMLTVVGASLERTRLAWIMIGGVCILAIIAIICFDDPISNNDGNYAATVYWNTKGYDIKFWGQGNNPDDVKKGVARAYYRPDMSKTGWAKIEIETQASYPDWIQAHAAGMLEGSLCWQLIYWHYINTIEYYCEGKKEFCNVLKNFLTEASTYTRQIAKERDAYDPYWHQVNLFYYQLDGLDIGWKYGVQRSRKDKEIDIEDIDFLWLNAVWDLRDLEIKYNLKIEERSKEPLAISLLKLLPDTPERFLLAHASAGYYTELLRIQKKYTFGFHYTSSNKSDLVPGQSMEFTSYPAAIYSQDDFYHILGASNLIVTGTIIKNHKNTQWNNTDTKQALLSQRVLAANRLAKTSKEWANIMSYSNSGTGNKEWLVFKPNQDELEVWYTEQLPGKTLALDKSKAISKMGYWACYGSPFYDENGEVTDYKEDIFSKVGKILQEGQKNVIDVDSLAGLMRGLNLTLLGRNDLQEGGNINLKEYSDDDESKENILDITTEIEENDNQVEHIISKKHKKHSDNNKNFESSKESTITKISYYKRIQKFIKLEDSSEESSENVDEENVIQSSLKKHNDIIKNILSGNIDLKISTGQVSSIASAGPPFTADNQIKPFQWSKSSFENIAHLGQLDLFNFGLVETSWMW